MTRMNWDRVRNWDRLRRDRSDMELSDERDERWFEREAERDVARPEPRPKGKAAPVGEAARKGSASGAKRVRPSNTAKAAGAPGARKSRAESLAAGLGITRDELQAVRRLESEVSLSFTGISPPMRLQRAAAELGMTAEELKVVRRVLNGGTSLGHRGIPDVVRALVPRARAAADQDAE